MTAGIYNLILDQGADCPFSVTWSSLTTGLPIDLTGWTAQMMIRSSYLDSYVLALLSTSSGGGITLGGTNGVISINVSATQTMSLPVNQTCYYDLKLFDPAGVPTRLIQGSVTNNPAITR